MGPANPAYGRSPPRGPVGAGPGWRSSGRGCELAIMSLKAVVIAISSGR
jgi:hypothetical protein